MINPPDDPRPSGPRAGGPRPNGPRAGGPRPNGPRTGDPRPNGPRPGGHRPSDPRPRPRDGTGRPLPPGQPDQLGDADPASDCPDAATAVDRLDGCLERGRFFAAHRVVLRLWRQLDPERTELWGAVAQLTGGCVHLERGNQRGASTLLGRAASRLAQQPSPQAGVDVAALATVARSLADTASSGGGDPHQVLDRLPRDA